MHETNNVICAKSCGFCFGVKRAVDCVLEQSKDESKTIYTVGELIHNPLFLKSLEQKRIFCTDKQDLTKYEGKNDCVFVIRAHGVERETKEYLENNGFCYIDATCPYVERIHKIVEENSDQNTDVIIFGNKNHPEVCGTKSYAKGNVLVFGDEQEIEKYYENVKILKNNALIVAQTTSNHEKYVNCQKLLKKLYTKTIIFDTICSVTEKRQTEAHEISSKVDVMIVIGAAQSSNSKNLFEICKVACPNTFFTDSLDNLPIQAIIALKKSSCREKAFTVGITAGASTPDNIIEEVKVRMLNLFVNSDETKQIEKPEIREDMSFGEMLDASYHTYRMGERAKGIITSVTPTEVHVDLGIKHTGILSFNEITDDPSVKLEEILKVGDEIEVLVVKFNDADGTVALSKKRIDADKNWQNLVEAGENGVIMSGRVVEAVRGGLVVSAQNSRIFVPASHTLLPKSDKPVEEKDLAQFVGQTVKVKILETNEQRKRAVGSIRLAKKDEREKAEAAFWAAAEVGQKYEGTVKSLTSYGAFVDIGGVDGMVHVTELSWKRIKNPAEVVKVGDKLNVFIKALDPEKRRISLGHKLEQDNPWTKFTQKYALNDVVDVKIVSLMPFGAFAEIIEGVDGLIHISQISDRRISKPAEVLNIGDTVQVKITAIDEENKKISLSMRALLEPEAIEAPAEGPLEEVVYSSEAAEAVQADETVEADAE